METEEAVSEVGARMKGGGQRGLHCKHFCPWEEGLRQGRGGGDRDHGQLGLE